MMYSNKFVVCILVNGNIQKELNNGVVKMPFNSEYAIRFRNKNDRRAVVKFFVDGENVSGGGYIIPANDHVDIKRHWDKDRAFKFVDLDSSEAVDAGKNGPNPDKEKGLIEAHFYLEKERPKVEEHHHHHYPWYARPYNPYEPWGTWNTLRCCDSGDRSKGLTSSNTSNEMETKTTSFGGFSAKGSTVNLTGMNFGSPCCDSNPASYSGGTIKISNDVNQLRDGCTVEGGSTGQSFGTAYIDTEETCTVLKIFLQGHDKTVETVRKTNKAQKIEDLESENEELRKKLAEMENERLKAELEKAPVKKPKKKPKKKV